MFITLVADGVSRDLNVEFQPEATVRDVAVAAGYCGSFDGGLSVDRRAVGAGDLVSTSGLHHGSVLTVLAHGSDQARSHSRARTGVGAGVVSLVTVGGLHAGERFALRVGRSVVGRGADADVQLASATVSRRHAAVMVTGTNEVTFADVGSRNGTRIGGEHLAEPRSVAPGSVLRLGAVLVSLRPLRRDDALPDDAQDGAATVAIKRRPRVQRVARDVLDPITPPAPVSPVNAPSSFSAATVVATVAMAGLMALVVRNPAFAALALIAPMAMVGTAVEQNRRARRRERTARREYEQDVSTYKAELDQRHRDEMAWRWSAWPDLGETVRRASLPSVRLWERRAGDDDFLVVRVGVTAGDLPIAIDLRDEGIVGIAGERDVVIAVARALVCQVAVHHGPADVGVAVPDAPAMRCEWDWLKWLPHVAAVVDERAVVLAVVDGTPIPEAATAAIVVAPTVEQLPPQCTVIIDTRGPDGEATYRDLRTGAVDALLADGCTQEVAVSCARALARFRDPEAANAGLPDHVTVGEVAGRRPRWGDADRELPLIATIGAGRDGPFSIDLVTDGPHALIAGTTGSGKSEFLRSLVVALALVASPEQVNFALIDFKGGSAFDACARLPHTVGVVTDLDEQLAARALRCFEAELRHRERTLRAVGAPDLRAYQRPDRRSLPRLVIVVDEFATLKAEVPDFVDALIGIAQRGRSLGIHLVLATQRPSGTVSDHVRANTNLRIAFRVQDRADSVDVVGVPDAAHLPRDHPGRAVVCIGHGQIDTVQFATSSAPVERVARAPVRVAPFTLAACADRPTPALDEPAELDVLVDAIVAAHAGRGGVPPRRPWPDPLPTELDLASIDSDTSLPWFVPFAVADDPDNQCRHPFGWQLDRGNLALIGLRGSGTSTALRSIVSSLAQRHTSDEVHVYVVAFGTGEVTSLTALPQVGAVIGSNEHERRGRLLRRVERTIEHRRALPASAHTPRIVIAVDGFEAAVDDGLARVVTEGGEVGVHVVVTTDRVSAIPLALAAHLPERLLFRLADAHDYAMAGLRPSEVPAMHPGRAVDVKTGKVVQVARPGAVAASIEARRAPPVDALPAAIPADAITAGATVTRRPWIIPIGLEADELDVASVVVHRDEHVLVTGPARSGRTNALAVSAASVGASDADVCVVTVTPAGSLTLHEALVAARAAPRALVLVDDAERIDDPTGAMAALLTSGGGAVGDVVVVAAVNATTARTMYQHWTRLLRRSRLALLLAPDADRDSEFAGRPLPRRLLVAPAPGRGWLVHGDDLTAVQVGLDST